MAGEDGANKQPEFSLEGHPMTKFSTGGEGGSDGDKHVGDDYFLNSNDDIRFFFEEGIASPFYNRFNLLICPRK